MTLKLRLPWLCILCKKETEVKVECELIAPGFIHFGLDKAPPGWGAVEAGLLSGCCKSCMGRIVFKSPEKTDQRTHSVAAPIK